MYRALLAVILIALASKTGRAQIFNWQTGALIPGTEMVVLGPGAQLTQWNTDQKNLRFGDFSDELDLTGANFTGSWLENARFWYADLTDATFNQASLAGAAFNLAIVKGANFKDVTSRGFTRSQLATTDSFNVGDMQGIDLSDNDLSGWIFQSLDLTDAAFRNSNLNGATFHYAKLQNVDFTGATLKGAKMWGVTTRGFTEAQLATVGSDLQGIELAFNDLSGWNFQGRDLTNALLSLSDLADADFSGANLTNVSLHGAALGNANFVGATVKGVSLEDTTSRGFTREQFESTADFQAKDLQGIRLWNNNLTDWDFGGHNLSHAALGQATLTNASFVSANLTNAKLNFSNLTNADFSGATITGANLRGVTPLGFTRAQLESTASFGAKNLPGVGLSHNDLTGWSFQGQNLTNADLAFTTLTGVNLTGATVAGASFESTTSRGFTLAQLQSTASYQAKELRGISLLKNDLTGWDLRGQNLSNAFLGSATLTQTNLTGADLRGVHGLDLTGAIDRNAILPDGAIDGLGLAPGERFLVRDEDGVASLSVWLTPRAPISVTIEDHLTMAVGSTLQFVFEADPWDSIIAFEPGIAVRLGGTLDLTFADGVAVPAQNGRTIRVFDWAGVTPTGVFAISSPYSWDVSKLYTTGELTLALPGTLSNGGGFDIADLNNVRNNFGGTGLGDFDLDGDVDITDLNIVRNNFGGIATNPVPEPHSAALLVFGAFGFSVYRGRRRRR